MPAGDHGGAAAFVQSGSLAAATVDLATAHLLKVLGELPALRVANCCNKSDGRVALILIKLGRNVGCWDLREVGDRLNGFLADNLGAEVDVAVVLRS